MPVAERVHTPNNHPHLRVNRNRPHSPHHPHSHGQPPRSGPTSTFRCTCNQLLLFPVHATLVHCPCCGQSRQVGVQMTCTNCANPFTVPISAGSAACPRCNTPVNICHPRRAVTPPNCAPGEPCHISVVDDPEFLTIENLQSVLADLKVDTSNLTERKELEAALRQAMRKLHPPVQFLACVQPPGKGSSSNRNGEVTSIVAVVNRLLNANDTVHVLSQLSKSQNANETEQYMENTVLSNIPGCNKTVKAVRPPGKDAAEAIVEYAGSKHIDFVVVGLRGSSHRSVGQITDKVLSKLCNDQAVIAAKLPSTDATPRPVSRPSRTFLLCTNGTEAPQAAATHLLKLVTTDDHVHVLHIVKRANRLYGAISKDWASEQKKKRDKEAHNAVSAIVQTLLSAGRLSISSVHHKVIEDCHDVKKQIIATANELRPCLLVLGKRNDTQRLGHLTQHVLQHSPCPVMLALSPVHVQPLFEAGGSPVRRARPKGLEWDGSLSVSRLSDILDGVKAGNSEDDMLCRVLAHTFSDLDCLVKSFVDSNQQIDLPALLLIFNKMKALRNAKVDRALGESIGELVARMKAHSPNWSAAEGQVFNTLLHCYPLYSPEFHKVLSSMLEVMMNVLWPSRPLRHEFVSKWSQVTSEHMQEIVTSLQQFVTVWISATQYTSMGVIATVIVLAMLHKANFTAVPETGLVPYAAFHNDGISRFVDMRVELANWRKRRMQHRSRHQSNYEIFSFVDFPFVLNAAAKTALVHAATGMQKEQEVSQALLQQLLVGVRINTHLVLRVRRNDLVMCVARQLAQIPPQEFLKPLVIVFEGEEGQDWGGPKTEFFQLILYELLHPDQKLFIFNSSTHLSWFNPECNTPNALNLYYLVGVLFGLALYNDVLVNVAFPTSVFKTILGRPPTLKDIKELDPELGKGLQDLLDYTETPEATVEDVFCRNFTIEQTIGRTRDGKPKIKTVDLKPNGSDIAVTAENRREFVSLYTHHTLIQSIKPMLDSFTKGFWQVCSVTKDELCLCHPRELEHMVCGMVQLDFDELQRHTIYKGGYSVDSQAIKWFWNVTKSLSERDQRRLLAFCTGSDRVPTAGLQQLRFMIVRKGGDSATLPVAHTCFNQLDLPDYKSEAKLKAKLLLAIQHCTGFGLR
eukprot:TRINITY_DN52679_c0_g1_i1.p1 TRINITY_DN52679_c0_g1~~TRINITY_DN52679_c0_g1_i1.p1  ORF type:complete len:1139 (+),score=98.86 TRINITY_DN52679_c0_g1_i1:22-3438(+)